MGQRCSLAADLYSFGILLIELITQEHIGGRGEWRLPRAPEECPQVGGWGGLLSVRRGAAVCAETMVAGCCGSMYSKGGTRWHPAVFSRARRRLWR